MPITLSKIYNIPSRYTDAEKDALKILIDDFRLRISDDDAEKNILFKKRLQYTDGVICALASSALDDVNGALPKTNYSFSSFMLNFGRSNLVLGMMIFALMREGLLQLKNQVQYNDSGISIDVFGKFPQYQSLYGMLLGEYVQGKQAIKDATIPLSGNMFVGISSEFGYRRGFGANVWGDY